MTMQNELKVLETYDVQSSPAAICTQRKLRLTHAIGL
jgi:hypothetical protein